MGGVLNFPARERAEEQPFHFAFFDRDGKLIVRVQFVDDLFCVFDDEQKCIGAFANKDTALACVLDAACAANVLRWGRLKLKFPRDCLPGAPPASS